MSFCKAAQETNAAHDYRNGVCIMCGEMIFNLAVGSGAFEPPSALKDAPLSNAAHTTPAPMTADLGQPFTHKPGCPRMTAAGDPPCTCGPEAQKIAALTARIAELEREQKRWEYLAGDAWKKANDAHTSALRDNMARVRLESELAAARKPPEDGEVANVCQELTGWVEPSECSDDRRRQFWLMNNAADLLTRQAAALKEAERNLKETIGMWERANRSVHNVGESYDRMKVRALAAEAKLKEAEQDCLTLGEEIALLRADLETARRALAEICDASEQATTPWVRGVVSGAIRALQQKDTAP